MLCEKVLKYLQSFCKKYSKGFLTMLRCFLYNSKDLILSLSEKGVLDSTLF